MGGGARDIGSEQLAQTGKARIGALAAQQAEFDGVGQSRDSGAALAEAGGAVAQQGHQIDGGTIVRRQRQDLPQQAAGAGLEQRHAGGVIDVDIKAAQLGGDATGQITVGGDDTDGLAFTEGLAGGQGDGAGLLVVGVGANDREVLAGLVELGGGQTLGGPAGGVLGQGQSAMDQRGARMIMGGQFGDVADGGAHGAQQPGQAELRMAVRIVAVIEQGGVIVRAHGAIEPGQHHRAARQIVDGLEQACRGGNGASGAGGNDRTVAIDQSGGQGLAVEPLAAQGRDVGLPLGLEPHRPIGQGDVEKGQRLLPVFAQIGLDLGDDGADLGSAALLGVQIIDQQAERFGHGEDFASGGRAGKGALPGSGIGPLVNEAGEHQTAFEPGGSGQGRGRVEGRQEGFLVLDFAAKAADIGQKTVTPAGEFIGQRQLGAAGGQDDGDIGEPEGLGLVGAAQQGAVNDAIGQGGDEAGMGGNGEQRHGAAGATSRASAAARPAASPT